METKPKITTNSLLTYALSAEPIIRKLTEDKADMAYGELALAIGLGPWKPWHRQWMTSILDIVDAVQGLAADDLKLDFDRIVNAGTRKPGVGKRAKAYIVK